MPRPSSPLVGPTPFDPLAGSISCSHRRLSTSDRPIVSGCCRAELVLCQDRSLWTPRAKAEARPVGRRPRWNSQVHHEPVLVTAAVALRGASDSARTERQSRRLRSAAVRRSRSATYRLWVDATRGVRHQCLRYPSAVAAAGKKHGPPVLALVTETDVRAARWLRLTAPGLVSRGSWSGSSPVHP